MMKKKKQALNQVSNTTNDSLDKVSEDNDCCNTEDYGDDCDEDSLDNTNDCSQIATNIPTSSNSSSGQKRSSAGSLSSTASKKQKTT